MQKERRNATPPKEGTKKEHETNQRVFVTPCARAGARLRGGEYAYLGVQAAIKCACHGKAERTTLPSDWSHATNARSWTMITKGLKATQHLCGNTKPLKDCNWNKNGADNTEVDPNERSHTVVVAQKKSWQDWTVAPATQRVGTKNKGTGVLLKDTKPEVVFHQKWKWWKNNVLKNTKRKKIKKKQKERDKKKRNTQNKQN